MKEIREIIRAYDSMDHTSTRCALAQVVHVEGSSYRRIGARMLVTDMGTWTGGISGGCLEGDALKRAKQAIVNNSASKVVYDTTKDDEYQIGVGLGCNGVIETLFTPINRDDSGNALENLRQLVERREECILLTVIESASEKYADGFSVVHSPQNDLLSYFPGLEESIQEVRKLSSSNVWESVDIDGRTARILIEVIKPRLHLAIMGDNYDIYPFIKIAYELGWKVDLYATLRKLKNDAFLHKIGVHSGEKFVDLPTDDYTAVILMNHDYALDKNILRHFLGKNMAYLGILGPRKRKERMFKELEEEGVKVDSSTNVNIFSPAGLDLGAEGPEQIALSMCSEIIAHLNSRSAGFLRDRTGTIHPRV